nr:MAG TPA: hypothetical protein [Caudoviricetes sp.]
MQKEETSRFVTDEEDLRIVQRFREENGLAESENAA